MSDEESLQEWLRGSGPSATVYVERDGAASDDETKVRAFAVDQHGGPYDMPIADMPAISPEVAAILIEQRERAQARQRGILVGDDPNSAGAQVNEAARAFTEAPSLIRLIGGTARRNAAAAVSMGRAEEYAHAVNAQKLADLLASKHDDDLLDVTINGHYFRTAGEFRAWLDFMSTLGKPKPAEPIYREMYFDTVEEAFDAFANIAAVHPREKVTATIDRVKHVNIPACDILDTLGRILRNRAEEKERAEQEAARDEHAEHPYNPETEALAGAAAYDAMMQAQEDAVKLRALRLEAIADLVRVIDTPHDAITDALARVVGFDSKEELLLARFRFRMRDHAYDGDSEKEPPASIMLNDPFARMTVADFLSAIKPYLFGDK